MQASRSLVRSPSSPRDPEMRQLAQKWERFVAGQEVDLSDIPPLTREAWIRAKHAGIDPAVPHAPWEPLPADPAVLQAQIPWLSCAEPVLAFLHNILTEPHQLIGLTDHESRTLLTRGGSIALTKAEDVRCIPGGKYGEESIGPNAAGTVLHTKSPMQICWQEHYCQNWKNWVAQGAPIHDPITSEVLGVVFTAGYKEFCHPRALQLMIQAAQMIETGIREQEAQARFLLLEHFAQLTTRYPADRLLAVDKRGYILAVNPVAKDIAAHPYASLIGQRIHDVASLREQLHPLDTVKLFDTSLTQQQVPGATIFPVATSQTGGAIVLLSQPSRPATKPASRQPWTTSYSFADLIGHSPQFRACIDLATKASRHEWPVLLLGESGTGKELFAHAIHRASPRHQGPFVTVSCAGISDELVGTELFGYADGTFTGAVKGGKVGKLQLAHTGTLFLDDIDGMSQRMQLSLLRVLEDHRVTPLGAARPQTVDVRIITASNQELELAVREGRFRHDLYYRLNVFPLLLPPLRERPEDIPPIVTHILLCHIPTVTVSAEALRLLMSYAWPGNVRELRNVLIAASARAENGQIIPADLPATIMREASATTSPSPFPHSSLKETEREVLLHTLQQTQSVSHAAELLALHFTTLYRKIHNHGTEFPVGIKGKRIKDKG